jgi:hypothetical protein
VLLHPVQWIGLIVICCGMAVNRIGMVGVSVGKIKALKVETLTLTGKGRQNQACFVHF